MALSVYAWSCKMAGGMVVGWEGIHRRTHALARSFACLLDLTMVWRGEGWEGERECDLFFLDFFFILFSIFCLYISFMSVGKKSGLFFPLTSWNLFIVSVVTNFYSIFPLLRLLFFLVWFSSSFFLFSFSILFTHWNPNLPFTSTEKIY